MSDPTIEQDLAMLGKRERSKVTAERRTNNAIRQIRLLGNCGNPQTYKYTDSEVANIFAAVDAAFRKMKRDLKDTGFEL